MKKLFLLMMGAILCISMLTISPFADLDSDKENNSNTLTEEEGRRAKVNYVTAFYSLDEMLKEAPLAVVAEVKDSIRTILLG